MKQIKLFSSSSIDTMEQNVNEWLKNKPKGAIIEDIKMSSTENTFDILIYYHIPG
jgi:hypothetical protein